MKVAVYFERASRRSREIARSIGLGVELCGDSVIFQQHWTHRTDCDVAVAYGWGHPDLFQQYRAAGKHFVYIDLGWWLRKPEGMPLEGFHKIVVDGREPTSYFRGGFPSDRFERFGLKIKPWRVAGDHILLAGMSAKSAGTRGYGPQEWERWVIDEIRRYSDREIWYRPKPSWADATPIPGTRFSPATESVEVALAEAWVAVTLHSNVAVDALIAGVPFVAIEGVCENLSTPLYQIEDPRCPDGREELLADIAYCQFNTEELRDGSCWRHLKARTPLCQ